MLGGLANPEARQKFLSEVVSEIHSNKFPFLQEQSHKAISGHGVSWF